MNSPEKSQTKFKLTIRQKFYVVALATLFCAVLSIFICVTFNLISPSQLDKSDTFWTFLIALTFSGVPTYQCCTSCVNFDERGLTQKVAGVKARFVAWRDIASYESEAGLLILRDKENRAVMRILTLNFGQASSKDALLNMIKSRLSPRANRSTEGRKKSNS